VRQVRRWWYVIDTITQQGRHLRFYHISPVCVACRSRKQVTACTWEQEPERDHDDNPSSNSGLTITDRRRSTAPSVLGTSESSVGTSSDLPHSYGNHFPHIVDPQLFEERAGAAPLFGHPWNPNTAVLVPTNNNADAWPPQYTELPPGLISPFTQGTNGYNPFGNPGVTSASSYTQRTIAPSAYPGASQGAPLSEVHASIRSGTLFNDNRPRLERSGDRVVKSQGSPRRLGPSSTLLYSPHQARRPSLHSHPQPLDNLNSNCHAEVSYNPNLLLARYSTRATCNHPLGGCSAGWNSPLFNPLLRPRTTYSPAT
jgi:hypothetical protein